MPTPGSPEAVALGCTCPVSDNANGKGQRFGSATVFWTDQDCPVDHWPPKAAKETKE